MEMQRVRIKSSVRHGFAAVLWVTAFLSLCARAEAQSVAFAPLGQTPVPHVLSFDDVVRLSDQSGSVPLNFNLSNEPVTVLNAADSAQSATKPRCALDVSSTGGAVIESLRNKAECADVMAPLVAGKSTRLLLVKQDASAYAVVEYTEPAAYAGRETGIDVPRTGTGAAGAFAWQTTKIPPHVALASEECWVFLEKARKLKCSQTDVIKAADQATTDALEAAWRQGQALTLYMKARDAKSPPGAWRRFLFTGRPASGSPTAPEDTLIARCHSVATDVSPDTDGDFYAVCVDAYAAQESVLVLSCADSKGTPECSTTGDVLLVRRNFLVFVWHEAGTRSVVKFGGTPGNESLLYEAKAPIGPTLLPAGAPMPQPSLTVFGPRKAGSVNLEVKIKKETDGTTVDLRTVERSFVLERYYRMALRLGLGFTWAPVARTVGIRSTADGQRHTAVTNGEGGLYSTEVVAGVSYFLCDMPDSDTRVCGALGIRFGLVSIQGNSTKAASSLMIGPELAIGKDFALGLFTGVIRHDPPDEGFEPGRLVPTDVQSVPTHFGFTPGVSLVLNFTPGFLSAAGVVQ